MATFKAIVRTNYKRIDDTYRIYIRVTHGRVSRFMPTPFYVTSDQLTRGGKLKDQLIIDKLEERIRELRNATNKIGFSISEMSVDQLIAMLTNKSDELDFFDFFAQHIESLKSEGREGTAKIYKEILKIFREYNNNKPLYFSQITQEYMLKMYNVISKTRKANTIRSYIGCIHTVYTKAIKRFNGSNSSVVVNKGVFDLIELPQKEKNKENVFKTVEEMQRIIDTPYSGTKIIDFAKDMFILSFVCLGTNMADWEVIEKWQLKDGILSYRRRKTGRLSREAVDIKIRVPEVAQIIIDKYSSDPRYLIAMKNRSHQDYVSKYIHYFYQQAGFENKTTLHDIGAKCAKYSFYANRHTMATIARNQCKVEYMTVNDMLNHSAPASMNTTDTYLFKDYSNIWEANDKLLSLFDWSFYLGQKNS